MFKDKIYAIHPIALGSSLLVFLILAVFQLFPEQFLAVLSWVKTVFVIQISWFYILSIFVFFCLCIYLSVSPYGKIRLGSLSQPKYSTWTWISMLFSTGMGTGLLFSSVYEPLYHYVFPPNTEISSNNFNTAFQLTFLHWGISGWVVYTLMGLVFSYFCLYKKQPFRISCMLAPFFKGQINNKLAWSIDIFSILAILFGVATSLARGALQINSGIKHLFDFSFSSVIQALIIIFITVCAIFSVLSGLNRGIKRLSQINLVCCFVLLLFVFIAGPSVFMINSFVEQTGAYIQNLFSNMTRIQSLGSAEWRSQWTILYWAWWIAWSPFVGMFIARISEGRTMREFIVGTLTIPSLISFLWFIGFGASAIEYHQAGLMDLKPFLKTEYSILIFKFLEHFPFSSLTSFIALIAVALFFITSSDSASYVIHNIASQKSSKFQKIYWASLEGMIALVVLFLGGIQSLELIVIITAFPFTVFVCLIAYGFIKELKNIPTPSN